jgi:hypothetical protein
LFSDGLFQLQEGGQSGKVSKTVSLTRLTLPAKDNSPFVSASSQRDHVGGHHHSLDQSRWARRLVQRLDNRAAQLISARRPRAQAERGRAQTEVRD